MQNREKSSREKIIAAAWDEFVAYGHAGARMQRIAESSGVNKAMIYYYFSSKDELFEAIIRQNFKRLFDSLESVMVERQMTIDERISQMVETHIDFMKQHPQLPSLFIREINQANPITLRVVRELFQKQERIDNNPLITMLKTAKENGEIVDMDPMQVSWNLIAMNIFYFITHPMLAEIWLHGEKDEEKLLKERKKAIVHMALYGLLPRS